ncbi:GNAT family N-acetyltransferase [Pseudonocardia spinosispora]|uniref:GNAT family N-acetyltransferase n=1 Tax=Pseudonocardia spinosispora TaxID=103441 RepID=UPI00048A478B|nr:GNAT family N-acetyltransferase [Pseudonocardia spinosispora]
MRSLGFRTDLMLLTLQGASVTCRDGYRVVRMPDNPTFRWGNFLLLDGAVEQGGLAGWQTAFTREFPGAEHVAIGLDTIDGVEPCPDELAASGLIAEPSVVQTTRRTRPPPRPDTRAEYRPMRDEQDWQAAVELKVANNERENPEQYRVFASLKIAAMRRLQERGNGVWFGAFADGLMVSGLGLFTDGGGTARYQSVDTRPEYRRRGLAGTLVHAAAEHVRHHHGVHTLVIVADPDYHAARLYRSLGFTDTEAQLQLERAP